MKKTQGSKTASLGDSNQIINAIREKEIEKFRKEAACEIVKRLLLTSTDRMLLNGKVRLVGWGTYKVPTEVKEEKDKTPKEALVTYLIRKSSMEKDLNWLMKSIKVESVTKIGVEFKGGTAADEAKFIDKMNKGALRTAVQYQTASSASKVDAIIDLSQLRAKTDQKDKDVEENKKFFSLFDKIGVTKIEGEELSNLTVHQLRTLAYIAKAGTEGVLAADMEDALGVGLSSIQRQLGRLSKKGYSFKTRDQKDRVRKGLGLIEEFQDPMNRKQSRWVLSKEGVKFFKSLNSVF